MYLQLNLQYSYSIIVAENENVAESTYSNHPECLVHLIFFLEPAECVVLSFELTQGFCCDYTRPANYSDNLHMDMETFKTCKCNVILNKDGVSIYFYH